MKIKIEVLNSATDKLSSIMTRLQDMRPVMDAMGRHMMPSIRKNFSVGGRPDPWAPLATDVVIKADVWADLNTKTRKALGGAKARVQGRIRQGGPLVLTGDLRGSIGFTTEAQDLVLWAKPTPGVKGPVHQYGTTRAGKDHNVTIPARPYLVFQQEDLDWFRASVAGWIRVGSLS